MGSRPGTGEIGPEARKYANRIITDSNLVIVMIDKDDVTSISNAPTKVVDVFAREAKHAMRIKRIEV
jgi:site-specific DNA-methyltransferase (cytosine-N4-specific)